jgi:hypothetical protein
MKEILRLEQKFVLIWLLVAFLILIIKTVCGRTWILNVIWRLERLWVEWTFIQLLPKYEDSIQDQLTVCSGTSIIPERDVFINDECLNAPLKYMCDQCAPKEGEARHPPPPQIFRRRWKRKKEVYQKLKLFFLNCTILSWLFQGDQ